MIGEWRGQPRLEGGRDHALNRGIAGYANWHSWPNGMEYPGVTMAIRRLEKREVR